MRYKIRHITEYRYQEMVSIGHNRLCLVPLTDHGQQCLSSNIKISPTPDELVYQTDFFGNTLLFISVYKEHDLLEITSESTVDIESRANADRVTTSPIIWEGFKNRISLQSDVYADVMQYTLPSIHVPYSETIREFASDCFPHGATLWSGCQSLMQKIYS